jgi:hypothetical protein
MAKPGPVVKPSALAAATAGAAQAKRAAQAGQQGQQQQRRDAKLGSILISERRDRKLAGHQAGTVPFPFTSREAYERSLRQPVGPEWNSADATAELTRPEVVTRAGQIIAPIAYARVKRGEGQAAARASSAVASVGQGKSQRKVR